MEKLETRLRPVDRKDETLKQRGYFACMLTRHPQHKISKAKKTELKTNKTTTNINKRKCRLINV